MVEYEIKPDFSELIARGKEIRNVDYALARALALKNLENMGLNRLETSDGRPLTVTLTINGDVGGTRSVRIETPPESTLPNLPEILSDVMGRQDIDEFRYDTNGVYFTKIAGSRQIKFDLITPIEHREVVEEQPSPAQPELPAEQVHEEPAHVEQPKAAPQRPMIVLPVQEITDYFVLGEREDFDRGSDLERKTAAETPRELSEILHSTIFRINTDGDRLPLVLYTTEGGLITRVDIMPPAGRVVTDVQLSSEARPADQTPGMIRCSYGPATVTIHRRNLDEKFDIRGFLNTISSGYQVSPPRDDIYQQIMRVLCSMPVIIRANDDTEANVVYEPEYLPRRIFIAPRDGSTLDIRIDESSKKDVLFRERFHRERVKEFELQGLAKNTTLGMVVFTTTGSYVKGWETMGGTGKRDIFDIFYDNSQKFMPERTK